LSNGAQRFISDRHGPSVPLLFDSVRALLKASPWRVDTFVTKPVETNPWVFEPPDRSAYVVLGIYAVPALSLIDRADIDLYFWGLRN
jgi:hypothetical protein